MAVQAITIPISDLKENILHVFQDRRHKVVFSIEGIISVNDLSILVQQVVTDIDIPVHSVKLRTTGTPGSVLYAKFKIRYGVLK